MPALVRMLTADASGDHGVDAQSDDGIRDLHARSLGLHELVLHDGVVVGLAVHDEEEGGVAEVVADP